MKKLLLPLALLGLIIVLSACGSQSSTSSSEDTPDKVVIGYFPNLSHAAGMVGEQKGIYQDVLGDDVEVEFKYFPDGSKFMTALQTGDIHAGIVGPGPAMNHYTQGAEVKVLAAASTGGTVFMARDGSGIETPEDIKGKTFISPRVGCTHNVQFEAYMKENYGITSDRIGGEMVHKTGKPAQYAQLFQRGQVDVATVPEPWGSVLEKDVNAKVIAEKGEVAFGDTLPDAVFAMSEELLENNPEFAQKLVNGHKQAIEFIQENPEESQTIAINMIDKITQQKLDKAVVANAWERINFKYDVKTEDLQSFANASYDLEFLDEKPDLSGLVDNSYLDN